MPPQAPLVNYKVAPEVVASCSVSSQDETIHVSNATSKRSQYKADALLIASNKAIVGADNWGYPGYLDESQAKALVSE